ncbi:MAG: DUF424 family protein [archaeon]
MQLKIHQSYRNVVSLCDSDILGKKFEEGKFQLDVRENFYKDKEVSEEEAVEILIRQAMEDSTFNIVGPQAIEAAKKAGILSGEPSAIAGIPFLLIL